MGNAVACQGSSQKSQSKQTKQNQQSKKNSHEKLEPPVVEDQKINPQIPVQKSVKFQTPSDQNSEPSKIASKITPAHQISLINNCLRHPAELIRAVCVSLNCPNQMTSSQVNQTRMLCCECLIEHQCPSKLKNQDFIYKMRNLLSKDTLDVFMELFDDNNTVKLDAEKTLKQIQEQTKTRLLEFTEKSIPDLLINYYIQQSDLKALPIELQTIKGLQQLQEGKLALVRNDTLDLAILLIIDPKMVERLCDQIETSKSKVVSYGQDFQNKFKSLLSSYIHSVKFLFELFPTQMDYIADEDQVKSIVTKKQVTKQTPDTSVLSSKNELQSKQKPEITEKKPTKQTQNQKSLAMCDVHNQEILAICITPGCLRGRRKLCTDCLIENADCPQRMKTTDFIAKVNRIINQEVFEELLIPWEDESTLPNIRGVMKVLLEGCEFIKQEFEQIIKQDLKNLFVKFHLIEQATPQDLRAFISKEYLEEFTQLVSQGKMNQNSKSVELGVRFIITDNLVKTFLEAIVKTEQIVPQKVDKLLHKLSNINMMFLERIHGLLEIFKTNFDLKQIQRFYNILNDEKFTLEESICKINQSSNTLSEWTKHQEFSPVNGLSITDSCYISDGLLALAQFDGQITLFNLNKQKLVSKLKHGAFVTSLVSFIQNGKPILISSGFSQDVGSSIAVWDLQSKVPIFQVQNAHKDSIRQLKMVTVNQSLSQLFGKNGDLNPIQHSSGLSMPQIGSSSLRSQSSIAFPSEQKFYEDQLMSCSDDGTVKLWKLDTNLKLSEDLELKKQGSCVLDFALLNGCILVTACIDQTVCISLPFNNLLPFQKIHDDSPVYSISPVDNIQKYFGQSRQQRQPNQFLYQKFITGNEQGAAKIYIWQNGKAVVQRVVNLHKDRINRIILIETGFIASISKDQTIALTLVQQPKILNQIVGHKSSITSVTFIKELQSIVTADQSGQVIVWK